MSDSIDKLKQGQTLTEPQRAALAKDNIKVSEDAHRLAADHRARDIDAGLATPPVQSLAESIKKKLLDNDFKDNKRPITTKKYD